MVLNVLAFQEGLASAGKPLKKMDSFTFIKIIACVIAINSKSKVFPSAEELNSLRELTYVKSGFSEREQLPREQLIADGEIRKAVFELGEARVAPGLGMIVRIGLDKNQADRILAEYEKQFAHTVIWAKICAHFLCPFTCEEIRAFLEKNKKVIEGYLGPRELYALLQHSIVENGLPPQNSDEPVCWRIKKAFLDLENSVNNINRAECLA